jgi:hypothetical protein
MNKTASRLDILKDNARKSNPKRVAGEKATNRFSIHRLRNKVP